MRNLLPFLLMLVAPVALAQQERGIGYPTVAAALEALKARSDVKISVQGGWTIVEDRAASTYWSFTPPGHPAYPAAVKRTVVQRDGAFAIDLTALCEAQKAACDKLVADFQAMNERIAQSARKPAPASEIAVERRGDDAYLLVLKSYRSRSIDAGQMELAPRAREVCGGKDVGYGKYAFEMQEPVGSSTGQQSLLVLRQEVTCGSAATPPPTVAVGNRDRNWRPTPAQVQLVERQTYSYFTAKDARKYQDAYVMFSSAQKQTVPFEGWRARVDSFNSNAGEVRSRTIKRITWYKDPPSVDPGVYAAVDFSSQFANINVHCGYVVWHEQADGSLALVREEENFIDRETEAKMKPGDLEQARAKFGVGC